MLGSLSSVRYKCQVSLIVDRRVAPGQAPQDIATGNRTGSSDSKSKPAHVPGLACFGCFGCMMWPLWCVPAAAASAAPEKRRHQNRAIQLVSSISAF
ncbi:hypothetical protein Hsero_3128 [Herbaspirillum seropedicae SmR1]|uniref:Uncharacterized protein n=1 Tax=Herbaspirillum seropedicae (strain SmR1) TaxID=757424 RepID=D8J143_HERSS|nr:hypothetical protein Hsero_3128 [Herbaspirillum seropedicae SmR1]